MTWNDGLSGKALAIAQAKGKYLRIMAGPGTGKSFAMKRRIARLLEEGGDPQRILAVTFTRVTARSLVAELRALGVDGCEDIDARTLHSFCLRLLKKNEVFDFSGRVARPLVTFQKSKALQFEASPLLADIRLEGKRKDTKRVAAFEASWARLQSDDPGWPLDAADREFHNRLILWLTFHRAMFIGEVVPEALRYLRNNPTAEELLAFDHVIVDEYQDLNRADQALLDLLICGSAMVIGDENQSIYGFRHAHPAGIIEFGPAHPPTEDADLDECRRCPTRVVAIANNLIMHNHPVGTTPRLHPLAGNPEGEVHLVQWSSLAEEAKGIAGYVHWLTSERDYSERDVLVLTPRRLIAYQIRDALVGKGVSAHSFYHEEALEDEAAQRAFTLLSLLVDPDDRVALRFWLGYGSSTWLAGEYAKLRAHCEHSGESPRETLEKLRLGTLSIAGVKHLEQRYRELVQALTPLRDLTGEPLVNDLFPDGHDSTRILREAALRVVEDDMPASRILDELRSLITQPEMPEDTDYVRIMSLQKSKGLTAKVVIVSGCIQGLIPAEDREETPDEQAETLREQRRLFYVAITRPTEKLVLSSFTKIDTSLAFKIGAQIGRSGRGNAQTISTRFISELGPSAPAAKRGDAWQISNYL